MVRKLGYSVMKMTRAFNELESVGEITKIGGERCLVFTGGKKALWEKVVPQMSSPVKKRTYIKTMGGIRHSPSAGLTALSYHSALAVLANPVHAYSDRSVKDLYGSCSTDRNEPNAIEIEIWNFSSALFAMDGVVDRISLFLSLQESRDERVEAVLEEMMKGLESLWD
jgi:hypothetical protein